MVRADDGTEIFEFPYNRLFEIPVSNRTKREAGTKKNSKKLEYEVVGDNWFHSLDHDNLLNYHLTW